MKKMMKSLVLLCMVVTVMALGGCADGRRDSLIGVWTLTAMTGSDDAVQSMKYYEDMGMKVSMAISSDQLEMVTALGSQSEYEVVGYRIEGDQIITDNTQMAYVLDGDTLSITTGGITMVFTRK